MSLDVTTLSALEMQDGEPSHNGAASSQALIERLSVQGAALDVAENAVNKRAMELQEKEDALQKLTSVQRQLGRGLEITKASNRPRSFSTDWFSPCVGDPDDPSESKPAPSNLTSQQHCCTWWGQICPKYTQVVV